MSRKICLLATILLAFLVSGCDWRKPIPDEQAHQFVDIPVPQGFKLLKSSYTVKAETIRAGTLKYRGDENTILVEDFYKRVMPKLGWELYKTDGKNDRNRLLFFRKERTITVVCIYRKMRKTYIDIELR